MQFWSEFKPCIWLFYVSTYPCFEQNAIKTWHLLYCTQVSICQISVFSQSASESIFQSINSTSITVAYTLFLSSYCTNAWKVRQHNTLMTRASVTCMEWRASTRWYEQPYSHMTLTTSTSWHDINNLSHITRSASTNNLSHMTWTALTTWHETSATSNVSTTGFYLWLNLTKPGFHTHSVLWVLRTIVRVEVCLLSIPNFYLPL